MMEIQAVLGRIQLGRMSDWNAARARYARAILATASKSSALRVPETPDHIVHAWYKAYAFVRPEALKTDWSRDRIIAEISALGVPCYSGACSEMYLERAFEGTGWRPSERLPIAQALGETSLMFLVHPTLTELEVTLTCDTIAKVISRAQRRNETGTRHHPDGDGTDRRRMPGSRADAGSNRRRPHGGLK